jgi:hypothetical protein
MGQHSRAISTINQLPAKKSQSPFRQNPLRTLQIQGSEGTVPILWDGSESKIINQRTTITGNEEKGSTIALQSRWDTGT